MFGNDIDTSITDRNQSQYSRDSARSPIPMQTSSAPSPGRLSMDYTPTPMSSLAFEDDDSVMADGNSPRTQRMYTPIPLSP